MEHWRNSDIWKMRTRERKHAVVGSCKFSRRAKTSRQRIMSFSSAKFLVECDFPAGKFAVNSRSGIENGRSSYPRDEFLIRPDGNGRRTSKLITQVRNYNLTLLDRRYVILKILFAWMMIFYCTRVYIRGRTQLLKIYLITRLYRKT